MERRSIELSSDQWSVIAGLIYDETARNNDAGDGAYNTYYDPILEAIGGVEHYLCPSYVDDDGQLRDCECGKCEQVVKKEPNERRGCKIADHIPTADGSACECGYFAKAEVAA